MALKKLMSAETANPYSAALEIKADKLVVLCGQVGEDENEILVDGGFDCQVRKTLENCIARLTDAGCSLSNVFKVNVFLSDISNCGRFNEIYREFFSEKPLPVRTTVQAGLPEGYLIEMELWAVKE